MQSALMGGVIFGISSVSDSFLQRSMPEGGPELSAPYIHAMYVLGTFFSALAPIGSGLVLESGGPRLSSVLSTSLFALGCGMFALSDNDTCMFLPAVCLLAFAGPGVHGATLHLANLFNENKGVATVCLTASFHLSFGCLYVVERLYRRGWDYRQIFSAYAAVAIASLVASLLLWPDESYELQGLTGREGTSGPPSSYGSVESSLALASPGTSSASRVVGPFYHPGYESPRSRAGSELGVPSVLYGGGATPPVSSPLRSLYPNLHSSSYPHPDGRDGIIQASRPFGRSDLRSPSATPPTLQPTSTPNSLPGPSFAAPNLLEEKHKNIRAHIPITSVASRSAMEPLEELGPYDDLRLVDLYAQLGSPVYRQLVLFFALCSFWANFYPGVAVQEMGDVYGRSGARGLTVEARDVYGGYLSLAMVGGMYAIPISALGMDHHSFGYSVLAGAVGLSLLLWSFLLLYQTRGTLLASFACYASFRSLLYSFAYSYVLEVFGGDHFGVLVGVLHLVSGIIGLLQLPLAALVAGNCHQALTSLDFSVCSTGSWSAVNFAAALSSAYCFHFAYNDWAVRYRLHQRKTRIGKEISTFRRLGTQLAPIAAAAARIRYRAPVSQGTTDEDDFDLLDI